MSKLWLIGLAASAAWIPSAMAHGGPPPPPPPPMAQGAHAPAPPPMMPGMNHPMPMPGGQMGGMHSRMNHPPMGHPPMGMPGGHMNGMHGFQHFGRGHVLPPQFRDRRFIVNDWRMFGFPQPMPGGNWIRYGDDALLIDGDGRVMDGRYGWDWDGRGGEMAYDDEGYDEDYDRDDDYGRGPDYGPGDDWDDGERGHHGDRVVRVIRRGDGGDCRRSCGPMRHVPPPGYGYGYGQSYGYGQGYGYGGCGCGGMVVTETTTTTAPVVETRTYYETVYEHRAAPRRHYAKPMVRHYSKPVVRRSVKSAPRPGERG